MFIAILVIGSTSLTGLFFIGLGILLIIMAELME